MPFGEIVPELTMLPATVAAVTVMPVSVVVLLHPATLPVRMAGQAASAGGVPIPMRSAANEVDANRARACGQPARLAASAMPRCAHPRTT